MTIKKKYKFRPKDGQPLADKHKFRPSHLLIFAVAFLIITLITIRKGGSTGRINLISTNKNQGSAVEEKERIEISGVKVLDFISKETSSLINQIDQVKSSSYYTLAQTPDYHIFYFPPDELFFISITSYPFDEHRPVAELKLLEILAISRDEACKLNVDITTPAYANPDNAGEVFKLSFCN